MSKIAIADVIDDWVSLVAAYRHNPELLQHVESELRGLEEALGDVRELKKRQNYHNALRQETTQELKAAVVRGQELATKLRSVARGKIGPKNERLVHFRVAPSRKRRRSGEQAADTPAEGSPAAAEPEGSQAAG